MTAFETLLFKGTAFSRILVIFKPYLCSSVWHFKFAADGPRVAQLKRISTERLISLGNQRRASRHTLRRKARLNYIKNTPLPVVCLSNSW